MCIRDSFEALFGKQMFIGIDLQLLQESENAPSTLAHVTDLVSRLQLIHETVQQNMSESSQRAKKFYDVDTETPQIMVGSKVLLHSSVLKPGQSAKFRKPWTAPTLSPRDPMTVSCTLYGIAIQANHYVQQCMQTGSNCTIRTETCFTTATILNLTIIHMRFYQIR